MATPTVAQRERSARGEGDTLRVDLLEAAAELMATHESIDAISLRAVARRAGVSPTAVYRHFDDHLDLLRQSVEYCWANFRDAMQRGKDSSSNPFEAFHNTGDAYVDFALQHRGQYRVLFSSRIDLDLGVTTVAADAFKILVDLVAAVLAANDDERDPLHVAVQTHTWIHGIVDLDGHLPKLPGTSATEMLDSLGTALGLIDSTN